MRSSSSETPSPRSRCYAARHSFAPELPASLGPHATWTGTASASGALPAGFWVRFVFGVFVPKGKMPEGLGGKGVRDVLIWITDHAHRLS